MKKYGLFALLLCMAITFISCSRRTHPESAPDAGTAPAAPKTVKKKIATPQVITVNDKYAKRSVDGRYYYDLQGKRYWRNNKDGKYYLFNKSMFDDPDFKSTGN